MHRPASTTRASIRASIASAALLCGAAQAQDCVTVEVHNVRAQQGQLMLAFYADADSFGKKPVQVMRLPADETTLRVEVCGLKGTEVALMAFQDLDSDGKLNRNPLGIPSEPWGSSGTPGVFGPSWETGKVALDGQPIVVRMSQ